MNDHVIFQAFGQNGDVDLFEDRIRIKRIGLAGLLTQGGFKEILLSHIATIDVRPAKSIFTGFITFRTTETAGLFGADTENTVTFDARQQPAFEQLKRGIEEIRRKASPPVQTTAADEIEKLASLRDRGILTEEEFTSKKRRMLGS